MRPSADKLYLNTLSVRGEKLQIQCPSRRLPRVQKQHRIDITTPTGWSSSSTETIDERGKSQSNKATIELKKFAPLCDDVITRQVRRIRQTVQVQELERLLEDAATHATASNVKVHSRSVSNNLADLYREFFGAYYDVVRDVVAKMAR